MTFVQISFSKSKDQIFNLICIRLQFKDLNLEKNYNEEDESNIV